jgi:uncharacterized glyoxalase superfamily protein PhnB
VAFFQAGGVVLALYPRQELARDLGISLEWSATSSISIAQNVRSCAEVDRVIDDAVAAGATLLKPGADVFWGGYVGYFADPEGFVWEVAWNPQFPLDEEGKIMLPA